jgi:outer membrane protein, multidrug efflux system
MTNRENHLTTALALHVGAHGHAPLREGHQNRLTAALPPLRYAAGDRGLYQGTALAVPTGGQQNGGFSRCSTESGAKAQVQNHAFLGTAEAVPCYRAHRESLRNQGLELNRSCLAKNVEHAQALRERVSRPFALPQRTALNRFDSTPNLPERRGGAEGKLREGLRVNSAGRVRGPRSTVALLLVLLLLVVFLPGCLVGPNYNRPKVNAPPAFRGAQGAAQQASFADLPWWEVFKDETLQGLIKTALVNNYDLRIAVTRIEQAQQVALEARAQFFPFFNYQGTIGGAKNPLGAIAAGGLGVTPKSQGAVLIAVTAAWEADVWGKIRRMNEAAKAQYLATEEGKRGVMLSLVSGVAQAYFQLLGLDLQLEIARQNTANFADTLKLFTERLEGGVASKLQTSRAAGAEYSAAANIPELERQIALTENQINVLLGQNPAPVPHTAKLLEETLPPEVPAGLPSALLERRPDVLTAEQLVRAANAQIGVAQANFFPQISLTAFLGRGSSPLSSFTSPNALVWNALANAAGPIYQGGLLRAQKRQAIAAWEQTALEYQQTALDAFQDVSNALISREKYEATRVEQARAVQAYEESVKVAFQRYNAGKASYYEVLEAQQLLFPAQSNLAQTELNQRLVIVQLYKALGGGWNLQDPQWMGPQAPTTPAPPAAPKP